VVVLERDGLASGASGACQGGVGFGLFTEGYELRLRLAAIAAYEELTARGLDVEFCQDGVLYVGEPEQEEVLKARVHGLQSMGIECEWLDEKALRDEEPAISPSISGGAVIERGSTVYPMRVVVELVRCAYQLGARIYTETELTGIEMTHGKVTAALTAGGRIATETIIIAAGAWSRHVGRFVGLEVPVWPLKGQVLVTEPVVPRMLRHYVSDTEYEDIVDSMLEVEIDDNGPVPGPPQLAAVLHPFDSGHILLGSVREFAGFDRDVVRDRIRSIARMTQRLVPGIAQLRILRTYTGLRPWTPDGLPLVGPTQQAEGIIFATGHAGDGNTLAIVTGNLIADLLAGRETTVETGPISPDRFVM
jgi:sarcosine oxidase subunit beta